MKSTAARQPAKAREIPASASSSSATALIKPFKAARNRGTPLLAIQTPDQFATMARLVAEINHDTPFLSWDVVRGFVGLNDRGTAAITRLCPNGGEEAAGMLMLGCKMAAKLDANCVLFVLNAQRHVDDAMNAQAVCNLRDQFKVNGRTLVLLGPQVTLPAELQPDFVVLDEPLPGRDELLAIIRRLHADNEQELTGEVVALAVDAVQGLPAFAAEQVTAMSMAKEGLDVEALWERKRQAIEQTPGLIVDRFSQTFDDIGGLSQAKKFGVRLFSGPRRPAVVCRIEEIEKVMAGAAGDTSGVSQDALQVILNAMEDHDWTGIVAFGPPCAGKSLYSKALARTFNAFSCALDLGATRGSLVGQSEGAIRRAMKVIHSVGGGNVFFVATANKLDAMPAELRRRFRYGVWMFCEPDSEERAVIWRICKARYQIAPKDSLADDDGFTGADIRNVCEMAYGLKCSLSEASEFLAPICRTTPQVFEEARKLADGRFLSASYPGLFRADRPKAAEGKRKLNMENE